jgi:serine/threonine-protein kinase RsbW
VRFQERDDWQGGAEVSVGQVGGSPGPEPYSIRFCQDDLRRVRLDTAEWGARAGLRSDRVDDFVIAVNEIATNAVRHGSPEAWLRLRADAGNLVLAEVRDTGRWQPGTGPAEAEGRGRMGLALVRRVCDDVDILTGLGGTTVVLHMRLDA